MPERLDAPLATAAAGSPRAEDGVPSDATAAHLASPAASTRGVDRFRVLRDSLSYSASAVVSQAVALVAGLVTARLLGPVDFGAWNALSLVLVYGAYVDLGVLSAMARDLPIQWGQGDDTRAAVLENTGRYATFVGAGVAAVLVLALSFTQPPNGALRTGLWGMAAVLLVQQAYTYHRTMLRARNEFGELSRQQLLLSLLGAVLAMAGAQAFKLAGRLAAAFISQAVVFAYALIRHPWHRLPRVDALAVRTLLRFGIPIAISGAVVSLVTTVDRLMVLTFLGEKPLGYFGLALVLTSTVSLGPAMASQVLYPRIAFHYGQSGRDLAALRQYVLIPPLVLASLLPIVIGPAHVLLPMIIRHLLPNFAPGIGATKIVILGIFFYSILGITDYFLVTIGRLTHYVLFGACALSLNVLADYVAIRLGYGIEGVAFGGTPLTYFVYSSVVIGYAASHYLRQPGEWIAYFSKLWLPFAYMVGLLWTIEHAATAYLPSATLWQAAASSSVQIVLYLAGTSPLVLMAFRLMKLKFSSASLMSLRAAL